MSISTKWNFVESFERGLIREIQGWRMGGHCEAKVLSCWNRKQIVVLGFHTFTQNKHILYFRFLWLAIHNEVSSFVPNVSNKTVGFCFTTFSVPTRIASRARLFENFNLWLLCAYVTHIQRPTKNQHEKRHQGLCRPKHATIVKFKSA